MQGQRVQFELAAEVHALLDLADLMDLVLDAHLDRPHAIVGRILDLELGHAQLAGALLDRLRERHGTHGDRGVIPAADNGGLIHQERVCLALERRIELEHDVAVFRFALGDRVLLAEDQE